jgi:hypothetical protein
VQPLPVLDGRESPDESLPGWALILIILGVIDKITFTKEYNRDTGDWSFRKIPYKQRASIKASFT